MSGVLFQGREIRITGNMYCEAEEQIYILQIILSVNFAGALSIYCVEGSSRDYVTVLIAVKELSN